MENKRGLNVGIVIFIAVILAAVVLVFVLYKPKSKAVDDNSNTSQTEGSKKTSNSKIVTIEELEEHDVSPESDFIANDWKNNDIAIFNYTGNDEIVVIPDTIRGKKVGMLESELINTDSNVKAVKFPDTAKEFFRKSEGDCSIFALNENIQTVILGDGVDCVPKNLFFRSSVSNVKIGKSVKRIETFAFCGCKNLKEIYIPENVEKIDSTAFYEIDNIVIKGKKGSAAEEFVNESKNLEIYKNSNIIFEEI